MERKRVYLCLAHMSGKEMDYIKEAFDTNWVVPLGPNVNGFEKDLASGVGAGDEVMVQSFTFCASSNPVKYLGATPVFVDSERDTWNMDPQLLDEAIADRVAKTGRKPKAIIVVYLYGMPAKISELLAVADKWDIPVIEDAAEGFGSCYKGQVCGTFGRYGVLSFNGNKMITTSGGGALICPDDKAWNSIMFLATQARESYPYYQHEQIGYNYRLSNVCAGIGRGQMTVVNDHIAHHRHVHDLYKKLLCTILLDDHLRVEGDEAVYAEVVNGAVGGAAGVTHAAKSAHTQLEPNRNVEAMRIVLDKANVEARPLWKPMHRQPVYSDCPCYTNGVSESLFKCGLCLPSGPCVSDEDVMYIVDVIKRAIMR